MIKVLTVLTDTNIGGAGRLLLNHLHNFDRNKIDMLVVLPEGSMLTPEVKKAGYEIIETKHGKDKTFEAGAVFEMIRIIRKTKPDIVHSHASLSARIAALLCGVKSRIYTRHYAHELTSKDKAFPKKQITGFVNNTLSTAVVAVSKAAAENLYDTGVKRKKVHVILNGVLPLAPASEKEKSELRASLGIKDDDFVLLKSARLDAIKGHKYLLHALAEICDAHKNTKLVIIGTGEEEKALKALTKELFLEKNVIFTGFVNNVAPYISIADININSSLTETCSLATSEAMTLSVPTVATNVGGNPEQIEDGKNGILVPAKDCGALAEAVISLINDPALLKALGVGAYSVYKEKFTCEKMTTALEKLYQEQTKGRRQK